MTAITLRLTHTGAVASSLPLSDVFDGTDGPAFANRKVGPTNVPVGQSVDLVFTSSVALSYAAGAIRGFINLGYLSARFIISPAFTAVAVSTETADFELDPTTGGKFLVDTSGGTVTVTLPPVADVPVGVDYTIKKITPDANPVRLVPDGAETIDTLTIFAFSSPQQAVAIFTDGTSWWVN